MIGTLLSGRFRLDEKIGTGGMSTVYRAFDPTLERWVAIKMMHRDISSDPDQLERFRREARTVARLNHPHVVTVIDAGEDDGAPYIVFEYVEGETLKERIRRLGSLPVPEAVAYAIEIGRALSSAHAHRLVHRDVKPQNVLIDADGRAKVTDFGIARSLEAHGLTSPGRVLGTTDYVSPEQALGHEVTEQSDIYSLGICIYEMLTGEVPYRADTQVAVAMQHVKEPLPDVQRRRPEISAAAALTIERATSKDLAKRYKSIAEMIDDLETALEVEAARAGSTEGEATTVLKAVRPRRRWLRGRSWRSVLGTLAVLALAGAVIAAVIIIQSGKVGGGGGTTGKPVAMSSATDFDPEGDGQETGSQVGQAIDGNPTGTAWVTEHYDSDTFAGTKAGPDPGVGIYVKTSSPARPKKMEVRSATPGWDAEVFAASGTPPADITAWGPPIGSVSDASGRQSISLKPQGSAQYFLLWFTRLGQAADQPTRYQAEIADIKLLN